MHLVGQSSIVMLLRGLSFTGALITSRRTGHISLALDFRLQSSQVSRRVRCWDSCCPFCHDTIHSIFRSLLVVSFLSYFHSSLSLATRSLSQRIIYIQLPLLSTVRCLSGGDRDVTRYSTHQRLLSYHCDQQRCVLKNNHHTAQVITATLPEYGYETELIEIRA